MIKILLKAAVLLFIVFSIYFIVNPSACSNMMSGQEVRSSSGQESQTQDMSTEQGQTVSSSGTISEDGAYIPYSEEGVFDTNTLNEQAAQPIYSQQDIDYAIASRYVELEREYGQNKTLGKDASREISFIVMDDFEMSPTEWESFLQRATASDLFNKVRQEMPPLTETQTQPAQ